jgi:hypothetical protein
MNLLEILSLHKLSGACKIKGLNVEEASRFLDIRKKMREQMNEFDEYKKKIAEDLGLDINDPKITEKDGFKEYESKAKEYLNKEVDIDTKFTTKDKVMMMCEDMDIEVIEYLIEKFSKDA